MADIKERRKDVGSIKEKHTSVPKALIKQETIHSTQWARQQVQEAAEPEHENNKGAGAAMPRIPASRIKRHSSPKSGREPHTALDEASNSTSKAEVMSTAYTEGKNPVKSQRTGTHAQEQGRKLAIHQEREKAARIKERTENVTPSDFVLEPHTRIDPPSAPTNSVRERPTSTSASFHANLHSGSNDRHEAPSKSIKAADQYKHSGVKDQPRTIKQAGQRVKTSEAVKAKKTPLHSSHTAKSVAKQTAKATKEGAAKLTKAVEKAAVSAVKSIGALLGGSAGLVAVLLVVIVLAAGLLLSPLGIFFAGEAESTMTLQQVMSELNTAFSDRITEIENANPHDDLRQDGQRPLWKDILTVYAVKTTTDPENPLDAVSMDDAHAEVLCSIFWDMTVIEFTTETYTEEVTVEVPTDDSTDEDGMTEETQTVERTRLVISISGKTAQQMAGEYGFDEKQLGYVTELLSDEYSDLWASLSIPGGGSDDIVAVALSQVGNVGGQPYWSWYGFSSRVAWCACFVSWCANQCGYIEAGTFPKFSYCDTGIAWFKSRGQWQPRGYCPSPGDIIFFDWNDNGVADHVGIVESCDGYYVYTVEGNANNAVQQLRYSVNYTGIEGYSPITTRSAASNPVQWVTANMVPHGGQRIRKSRKPMPMYRSMLSAGVAGRGWGCGRKVGPL